MNTDAPFGEGDVLAGKFKIIRAVGRGGMGLVFEAEHLDLGRRVALKVLSDSALDDDAVTRLFREARAAARLQSPHVTKVLDVGRLDSGAPYLVMELLTGRNLQTLLAEDGPLPVEEAVDYMLEACEALAEAHAAGIVHRDIKPANLFRATDAYGDRVVKLLDFGISKIVSDGGYADPRLTDSRALLGSPVYMSPEQLQSTRTVDHRSDVWSLGTVLFELVSGRAVWSGHRLSDLILQIANDKPPSLTSVVPSVPTQLEVIVARCLEKNPARRFQHVADLAVALAPLGSERARGTLERVLRLSNGASAQAQTTLDVPLWPDGGLARLQGTLQGTSASEPLRAHRGVKRIAVGAGLALLSVSVLVVVLWRRALSSPPALPQGPLLPGIASQMSSERDPAQDAPKIDIAPQLAGSSADLPAAVTSSLASAEVPHLRKPQRAPHGNARVVPLASTSAPDPMSIRR